MLKKKIYEKKIERMKFSIEEMVFQKEKKKFMRINDLLGKKQGK